MKINPNIAIELAGENALMLYFSLPAPDQPELIKPEPIQQNTSNAELLPSTIIHPDINNNVQQAAQLIKQNLSDVIIDLIPSYASILVMFDLNKADHYSIRNKLKALLLTCGSQQSETGKLVELPVYYSQDSGPDLARIAGHAGITVEEVIHLHQAQEYRVYAIGFAPGFAYLGEVNEQIAMPRLATPRLSVPKGAVAIADRQTAVYPAKSPGGWNIIGLCPVDMFNAEAENAEKTMPVAVGDRVKFITIDKTTYLKLGGELSSELSGELSSK